MIESLLHLMQARDGGSVVELSNQGTTVEMFDRIAALDEHRKRGEVAFRIYFRGFEPFVRAAQADLVIDRPIRPSALEQALAQAAAHRPAGARQVARTLSAGEVLRWLRANRSVRLVHLQVVGLGWWCRPGSEEVYGTPLGQLGAPNPDSPLRILLDTSADEMPAAAGVRLSYEQWVYAIAQHSDGAALMEHDDQRALVLERSVAVAANNRDFARLSALFLRPVNVIEAARLGRVTTETVRRFLNASIVIGRLRAAEAPACPKPVTVDIEHAAVKPTAKPATGLFSRLFKRLVEGRADVR